MMVSRLQPCNREFHQSSVETYNIISFVNETTSSGNFAMSKGKMIPSASLSNTKTKMLYSILLCATQLHFHQ